MLPDDFVTHLPEGGYLIFPRKVFEQCCSFAQKTISQSEAGGVLIGCIRGPHLEITDATTPDRKDKRSRVSFERCSHSHYEKVLSAWKKSNNTETYLGEWHTHPEAVPEPSPFDIQQWRIKLPKRTLVLLIVGTEKTWVGLWTSRGKIVTLTGLQADIAVAGLSESLLKPSR